MVGGGEDRREDEAFGEVALYCTPSTTEGNNEGNKEEKLLLDPDFNSHVIWREKMFSPFS